MRRALFDRLALNAPLRRATGASAQLKWLPSIFGAQRPLHISETSTPQLAAALRTCRHSSRPVGFTQFEIAGQGQEYHHPHHDMRHPSFARVSNEMMMNADELSAASMLDIVPAWFNLPSAASRRMGQMEYKEAWASPVNRYHSTSSASISLSHSFGISEFEANSFSYQHSLSGGFLHSTLLTISTTP